MKFTFLSSTPLDTRRFGEHLASLLRGGDVICLIGDLGAGKTALAQGIGEGLKVIGPLTSPTFTLIQEYPAETAQNKVRFIHMDLYRLQHIEEAEVIGVEDFFQRDCICLIEWPQIARELMPVDALEIIIDRTGETERKFLINCSDLNWEKRLSPLFVGGNNEVSHD